MRSRARCLVSLLFLVAVGCSDSTSPDSKPVPSRYADRATPENVLGNLLKAMKLRDIEGYAAQLDRTYTAVGTVDDDERTNFARWNLAYELEAVEAMFDSSWSVEIELDRDWRVAPSDDPNYPAARGFWSISVTLKELWVLVHDARVGEDIAYMAAGQLQRFTFRPDTSITPPEWRLACHEDIPAGSGKPVWMSWTKIKCLFGPGRPVIVDVDVPDAVAAGQPFHATVEMDNYGGDGPGSQLWVEVPSFTMPDDTTRVTIRPQLRTVRFPAGSTIETLDCGQRESSHLGVVGRAGGWTSFRPLTLDIEFAPREPGIFEFHLSAIRRWGPDAECRAEISPREDESTYTGQRGNPVLRYQVPVLPPAATGPLSDLPSDRSRAPAGARD